MVDLNTGQITIDGTTSIEQTDATRAVRKDAVSGLRRYFQVEAALDQDPTDLVLQQKLADLKDHLDLVEQAAERKFRLAALRSFRRA